MSLKSAKILVTGLPGCGKTTAIMRILANLNCESTAGFYTQEVRKSGRRTGFMWNRLDGSEGILADVRIKGPPRVGKYGVNIRAFEESVVSVLTTECNDAKVFVIDEIGRMECFSAKFVEAVRKLFASDKSILASVARKGPGLISEVKNYPETQLFKLTTQNREDIIAEISQILSFLTKGT
jgi:nucleoside-triphosphatase